MTPPTRLRLAALLAATAALGVAGPSPVGAVSVPERTVRVSESAQGAAGAGRSGRPSISPRGTLVAFESTATDLAPDPNGPIRDVFLRDLSEGTTRLVSAPAQGQAADGPSESPSLAGGADVVAFASAATNLVPDDRNGRRDVFVRGGIGEPIRVSVATGGGEGDGDSTQPDISRDGQVVVFTSSATNLVPNDTNGVSDVFAFDLETGTLERVSVNRQGEQSTGASLNPAISPDGRYVAFASEGANLVRGDSNRIADVFVADLRRNFVERVSVSSRERAQNRSVVAPFSQIADVSEGGRFVVFDSDGTNLVPGDRNEDTDVFIRDRRTNRTRRASLTSTGRQGTNDSFAPSISPSGKHVVFESFADDMAPGDAPGEDIFVRDVVRKTTVTVNVTSRGGFPRGPERLRQLLQRPALTDDATAIAFTSSADNLVARDGNQTEDVFVRDMRPPRGGFARSPRKVVRPGRSGFRLVADDRAARIFLCSIDGVRRNCGLRTGLPRLKPGRYVLRVSAGGPGMLFSSRISTRRFRVAAR